MVTVQEVQTVTGNSANVTVTAPATVQAGDLLLAHLAWDGYNAPAITSVPAGWTEIATGADGNTVYGGWWWKLAGSSDASASWEFTGNGNSEQWVTNCVRITGHYAANPIEAFAGPAYGPSSGPFESPSVTTDADNCLIIYSLARDGTSTHTPPSGCVELFDQPSAASAGTAAYKTLASAGSSGTGEFTDALNDQWVAITLAIAPEEVGLGVIVPIGVTTGAPELGAPTVSGDFPPIPVFEDGFESGDFSKWSYDDSDTSVVNNMAHSGTHSAYFSPVTSAAYIRKGGTGVTNQFALQFYVRFESLPSATEYIWYWDTGVSLRMAIHYENENQTLEAQLEPGDTYISNGPVIYPGVWYKVDVKVDLSGTTHTLDWAVDDTPNAQVARPGSTPDTVDDSGGVRFGTQGAGDANFWIDDVKLYDDLSAYPDFSESHELTSTGVLAGAPVVGAPTPTQLHELAAQGTLSGAPVIGAPAVSQTAYPEATSVLAGAPVVGTPSLDQLHELAAQDTLSGQPVLGEPTPTQRHALAALPVATGAPEAGATVVGQVHHLLASPVASGEPEVGSPEPDTTNKPQPISVLAGVPVVGAPVVMQVHELDAVGVVAGAPVVGEPEATLVYGLAPASVLAGAPVVGTPGLSQLHELDAVGVVAGAPVVGEPSTNLIHELDAVGVVAGQASVGAPEASITVLAGANGVLAGTPVVGGPGLSQLHELDAAGLDAGTPETGEPVVGQAHGLQPVGPSAGAPVVGAPGVVQVHGLAGIGVVAGQASVGAPGIVQVHRLGPSSVVTLAPVVIGPLLGQTYSIIAVGATLGQPVVGDADLSQTHVLAPADVLTGAPAAGAPSLFQLHALVAQEVEAGAPVVEAPIYIIAVGEVTAHFTSKAPTIEFSARQGS